MKLVVLVFEKWYNTIRAFPVGKVRIAYKRYGYAQEISTFYNETQNLKSYSHLIDSRNGCHEFETYKFIDDKLILIENAIDTGGV